MAEPQTAESQTSARKVVVSGASGFVGSHVVAELQRLNYKVLRLVRNAKAPGPNDLLWQPELGVAQPERLAGCSAIIHLAGRSIAAARWSEREKNRIYESRVTATKQLVKQLLQLEDRPPVFISASAVGIYGEGGDQVMDENSPAGEGFLADVAKDWEAAAAPLADAGVRVAFARFGIVLDPAEGALAKMLPLFRYGLGGRLASGKHTGAGLPSRMSLPHCFGCWKIPTPPALTTAWLRNRLRMSCSRGCSPIHWAALPCSLHLNSRCG